MFKQLSMPPSFYRQLLGLIGVAFVSYFFTNSANAYLVNVMGHDIYGDYAISIALLFSLTPFFALGASILLLKRLPSLIEKKDTDQQNIFLKWSLTLLLKATLIAIILLALSYALQHYLQSNPHCFFKGCQKYRHLGRDMLYLIPVVLFLLWNSSLLIATKNSVASKLIGVGNTTFVVALLLLFAEIFIENITHPMILIILFAAFFVLWLLQSVFIYVVMIRPRQFSLTDIQQATVSKEKARQLRSDGIGLMINQIAYVCLGLINMLLLEAFAPDEATVGHYVIVMYIANFGAIVSMAMSTLLQPYLAGLDNSERVKKLQHMMNIRALLCFLWLLIALVVFLLFKPLIFKLYVVNFPYATLSIIFLLIFYYIFGLLGFSETICLFNNMNRKLYWVTGLQIVIQGSIAFLLIPHYSFFGAIIAFTISELIIAAICWVLMKRAKIDIKILGFI